MTLDQIIQTSIALPGVGSMVWIVFKELTKSATKTEVDESTSKLKETVADHEKRITTLEAHEDERPTKDDLHALSREVAELSGEVKSFGARMENMAGEIKGLRGSIEGVKDYLLNERNR